MWRVKLKYVNMSRFASGTAIVTEYLNVCLLVLAQPEGI